MEMSLHSSLRSAVAGTTRVQAPWLLRGRTGRAWLGPLSGDGGVGLLGVPRWSSDSQVPTSLFPGVPPGGPQKLRNPSLLPDFCVFPLAPYSMPFVDGKSWSLYPCPGAHAQRSPPRLWAPLPWATGASSVGLWAQKLGPPEDGPAGNPTPKH